MMWHKGERSFEYFACVLCWELLILLLLLFLLKRKKLSKKELSNEANNFARELVLSPIFGMNKQEKVGVGVNADFV
jgi:hypothetical protein